MKNLVKSATSEQLADKYGVPYREYVEYYKQIAGDTDLSMIITGNIAVSLEGRAEPNCIYCTHDEVYPYKLRMHNLNCMVSAVKTVNPRVKLIAQLNHGGRQIPRQQLLRNGTKKVISSKTARVKGGFGVFRAPNRHVQQCTYIQGNFYSAAKQMKECGFDGVQIHCAHGYLLSDCLDTHDYDFVKNLITEVLSIRSQNFLVGVKVSAEPSKLDFIQWCCERLDFVEFSKGNHENPLDLIENQHSKPSFAFIDQHQSLRKFGAKIICTGGFRGKDEALQYLQQNKCDFIGLGRLYCLPQHTKQVKYIRNNAISALRRFMPLANVGAQTILYQEMIRRQAHGIAGSNEQEFQRASLLWWILTLFYALIGVTRYKTKRQRIE